MWSFINGQYFDIIIESSKSILESLKVLESVTSHLNSVYYQVMMHLGSLEGSQEATMGDKSVETLNNKIEFLSILVTFSPFPPKQC